MSERIETADIKLFLKHKFKDNDYLTNNYIVQDDREVAEGSYGIVAKVECRDSGNLYAIKKVTWNYRIHPRRRRRHPDQEEEVEKRITQFYQMFFEAVVHECYELNDFNPHLMRHHFHKSWYVLPPTVTAEDLTDFVNTDNGLTPELLDKFSGVELYMVFELMDTTMMSIMAKGIPATADRKQKMMPILSQVNQGLASMHGKGLIHGDVKPNNILLSQDDHNNVKLGDFGLTTDVNSGVANEKTESRSRYFGFAPEDYFSVKYDIFSYGVVFFAALVFMQTNIIVRRITLQKLRRFTLEGDFAQLRRRLNGYLIDQDKHHIELTIQCLQLDPSNRPNCKIIASVVDNDEQFVSAKNSIEIFVAQNFVFRPGFQPEQMIYPSFVRKVLKTYRRDAPNQDPDWVISLETFLNMEGDDKVVDVYNDWNVLMKDEFVTFLNEYM